MIPEETECYRDVMSRIPEIAREQERPWVNTTDLLVAILRQPKSIGCKILTDYHITEEVIRRYPK
jgi:hypothetical protein